MGGFSIFGGGGSDSRSTAYNNQRQNTLAGGDGATNASEGASITQNLTSYSIDDKTVEAAFNSAKVLYDDMTDTLEKQAEISGKVVDANTGLARSFVDSLADLFDKESSQIQRAYEGSTQMAVGSITDAYKTATQQGTPLDVNKGILIIGGVLVVSVVSWVVMARKGGK